MSTAKYLTHLEKSKCVRKTANPSRRPISRAKCLTHFKVCQVCQSHPCPAASSGCFFFCLPEGVAGRNFFGLFPLVYEQKTLETGLWPAET